MRLKPFSFSDIALGNLRHHKRQYILLGVGIVLAIYFAATSLLFGYGLYTSIAERMLNKFGDYDVALFGLDDAQWNDLTADDTVECLGKAEILAFAVIGDSGQNTFPIAKFDGEAIALTRRRLKEGAFPQKTGEIALSQAALAWLRTDAGIGDTVTLTMRIPDGRDFLPGTVQKTYTLTGILYDQVIPLHYTDTFSYDSQDHPAGMFSPAEQVEPGGRGAITAYGTLFVQNYDTLVHWSLFSDGNDIKMYWNLWELGMDWSASTMAFTGGSIIIIGVVLVLVSCLGIVNAFAANLDARRRQIGLQRAVGATRGQIRRIFRREAMIIALIAAPLGLGLAVATVCGVFALLGGDYHFMPNAWVLLGVAIVGIGCIAIASSIPLWRAAAVSPMQAVRDVNMVHAVKKKAVKSKTQFDVARLTASRANRIYRTRQIGIGIMLALGILVFSLVAYIVIPSVQSALDNEYSADYQIYGPYMTDNDVLVYGFHTPGLTEGDKREIASLPPVVRVEGVKNVGIKILTDKITPYATWDGWQWEYMYLSTEPPYNPDTGEPMGWYPEGNEIYQQGKAKYGYTGNYLNIRCTARDEDRIRELAPYVYEGRIDMEKLRSGEEVLLVAPEQYDLYYTPIEGDGYTLSLEKQGEPGERVITSQKNDMFKAGDTIDMSLLYADIQQQHDDKGNINLPDDVVRIDRTAKIGALLNPTKDTDAGIGFLKVITTFSGLNALGYDVPYRTLEVTLSETPDPETEAYLQQSLELITSRIPEAHLISYLERARDGRRFAMQIITVAMALTILMIAIIASMMNNTLSAHICAGRRGIGTLRAVGVSDRVIFRSYLYQLLYLFAWGGGIGYVLSIVFASILRHYMVLGVQNGPIPYWQPILFIVFLFGLCLINVRMRLRSVLWESVIDNIRIL